MSYIGNQPYQVAFVTDTFSGSGGTTFTMSVAPANTSSVLVAVTGVLQDPSTYSVSGTTLTFSAAPPTGTGNISVRYLGIPASGVTTTAYRTVTEFTATAGQTTFTPPSYTAGFINVYRNGVLLGTADYTASNGTTVVLASGATVGDLVTVESFLVSSVLNAIPATANSVARTYMPVGSVLQVVTATTTSEFSSSSSSWVTTGFSASITPTTATSKILITYGANCRIPSTAGALIQSTIYRGGSNIAPTTGRGFTQLQAASANQIDSAQYATYLDSPATTSSTTYTVYIQNTGTAGTVKWCVDGSYGSITLMEISA
jgi:hypothetical protein